MEGNKTETKRKIVVIVGPTAAGKTSLSIDIAKKFAGEVISADSRQVYRGLDIGTEKVTKEEMQDVPHHLLDIAEPSVVYTATDFKRDAEAATKEILSRNHLPIIAGGTFFYIDTFLEKFSIPEVSPNPSLRAELESLNTDQLYERLSALDSKRAATIDPDNHRRLMRSIEIAEALGHVPESETRSLTFPYEVLIIGIETDRTELRARIRARAEQALTKGLVEETAQLLEQCVTRERLSEIGLEYRIIMEYMDGQLTDQQLIQKLEEKNWQYAKRQLTWLKRDTSIEWYARPDTEAVFSRIQEFLK